MHEYATLQLRSSYFAITIYGLNWLHFLTLASNFETHLFQVTSCSKMKSAANLPHMLNEGMPLYVPLSLESEIVQVVSSAVFPTQMSNEGPAQRHASICNLCIDFLRWTTVPVLEATHASLCHKRPTTACVLCSKSGSLHLLRLHVGWL